MFVYHRDPTEVFTSILAIFLVFPIHEWAHAYVAYLLGDYTAKYEGRMSINPMRHLTLWGSLSLILFGFGWAKPVPINPYNLVKIRDKKVGFTLCALAGPAANFLMAIICMIIYKLLLFHNGTIFLTLMFKYLIEINVSLMVFNLLPIPPLDGSRIWSVFLKDETYNKLLMNEQKIVIIVLILLFFGILEVPLKFLAGIVFNLIDLVTWFIR